MIAAQMVREVSRTSLPVTLRGWALTVDHLIDITTGGDWETGYYQLTGKAAQEIAIQLNHDKPWLRRGQTLLMAAIEAAPPIVDPTVHIGEVVHA